MRGTCRVQYRQVRAKRSSHVQNDPSLLVFSGNANRPLAEAVCKELGIRLGKAQVGRFSDGEVQVEI